MKMTDLEMMGVAFDLLEGADVIQEFEDSVWLKVDRELWETFIKGEQND